MDDYRTRERRAFRAGWLAALRMEIDFPPDLKDVGLDRRWSAGFLEGSRLRQDWDAKKAARHR